MLEQINKSYCCVGLMSGTSLDGLDIALCNLSINDGKWSYSFVKTQTVKYSEEWERQLRRAYFSNGSELMQLHRDYGKWLGQQVAFFLQDVEEKVDFIASHGHTIYHEPWNQMNFQLGDGGMIAAVTGITTISDFRSLDICFRGQGAPLVPVGDHLLFDRYTACVNLGGFANVSVLMDERRIAWDICAVNFILNKLAQRTGKEFDEDGQLGRKGQVIDSLLQKLNNLEYYQLTAPKSLGQEWVEKELWPVINEYANDPVENIARTYYEHVATIFSKDLNAFQKGEVLFTGGGVNNGYLMDLFKEKLNHQLIIPDQNLIDYKEALIFAFLGVLRFRGENNCWSSVTGASKDSCSGVIHKV
ncbi:anhydro-N-acetylmuramic acid kinase [Carboxylicivirga caseinilyticus]|uniref:anhydro-N-acetylmuramic acid kinase n=1 Tax=Carboxylicivirga caseinilyticus TaxID=3417572 RepID=UPI003D337764|nr:anhydro-N-acetylmuramic acid kinase [Marinilabiliaceae bacterium A049]